MSDVTQGKDGRAPALAPAQRLQAVGANVDATGHAFVQDDLALHVGSPAAFGVHEGVADVMTELGAPPAALAISH